MRRLVSIIVVVYLVACAWSAPPCMAGKRCCDEDPAQHPGSPVESDCACCPQARPAVIPGALASAAPPETRVSFPPSVVLSPACPAPREILHVPKAERR